MKKKLLIGVIICVILTAAVVPAAMAASHSDYPQVSTYIDGELVEMKKSAILVDNARTYVPLRGLSEALGATDISWNDGTATVTAPGLTIDVTVGRSYIIANGRYLYTPKGILNLDGHIMVPARTFAEAFDADIEWDGAAMAVRITTGSGAIQSGDSYYDSDDVYWLSRIINAESGNQPFAGKVAVGTVIMNRVNSSLFPDNIYDVIFDFSCGVQFTPAYTGSVYNTPNDESVIAAKVALDGGREAGDSLFFASIRDCWAAYNRPFVTTIGGHDFYA